MIRLKFLGPRKTAVLAVFRDAKAEVNSTFATLIKHLRACRGGPSVARKGTSRFFEVPFYSSKYLILLLCLAPIQVMASAWHKTTIVTEDTHFTLDFPEDGSIYPDGDIAPSGKGLPGATVELDTGNGDKQSLTVPNNGNWQGKTIHFWGGQHYIYAFEDMYGHQISKNIRADFITLMPLTISSPGSNYLITTTPISPRGKATPGAHVDLSLDGTLFQNISIDPSTVDWQGKPLPFLAYGTHVLTADERMADQPVGSHLVTFTVGSPLAITSPKDNTDIIAPIIFKGQATPEASVHLQLDNKSSQSVYADATGNWQSDPGSLADGHHTLTATQTYLGISGDESDTKYLDFNIFNLQQLTINIADHSILLKPVVLSGTGTPTATVKWVVDNQPSHIITIGDDGHWQDNSFTPPPPGPHTLTALQMLNGKKIGASVIRNFTVPNGLTITVPGNGRVLSPVTPAGHATPSAQVTLQLDQAPAVSVRVKDDGTWQAATAFTLAPGLHAFTAQQMLSGIPIDKASVTFTVASAPSISAPINGSTLINPVVFAGHGEADAQLNLQLDGTPLDAITIAKNGAWQTRPLTLIPGQTHTLVVTQIFHGVSLGTASVTFNIARPVSITVPDPRGSALSHRYIPIAGTGEPGATITLSLEAGWDPIAKVLVDSTGHWSALGPSCGSGDYTLTAVQKKSADPLGKIDVSLHVVDTSDSSASIKPAKR